MSEADILQTLRELAREKLAYHGSLAPEMRLVEDLELDSIRLLTLAMAVEDRFRICLDEDDEAALETVDDLVVVIAAKTGAEIDEEEDEVPETVEIEPVRLRDG